MRYDSSVGMANVISPFILTLGFFDGLLFICTVDVASNNRKITEVGMQIKNTIGRGRVLL
jgi:hypothetical protein